MRKREDPIDSTEPAVSHGERERVPDGVPDSGPQSVYGRWSRRKARARAAPATARADAPLPGSPEQGPTRAGFADPGADPGQGAADAPRARALTDADMPALETLGEDDDYSGFLSPGVSEQLRLKALRKLFTGSKFNVTDGLDDYADDFTSFEPLGDIITSDMRHRIEMEAERARLAAGQQVREQIAAQDRAEAGAETDVAADAPVDESEPASQPPASEPDAPHAAGSAHAGGRERDDAPTARLAPLASAPDASAGPNGVRSTVAGEAPSRRVHDDG